jgi:hypothetical protein
MNDDTPKRFSDEQARAILARAIEIDARAPMTTTDELRAIAAELGVSPASLEAAVREQTTAQAESRHLAAQRKITVVAASGVPLGIAAGWLLSSGTILAALGLMGVGLIGSGYIILHGASGTLRAFHLKNLVLWGGVAAGSLASIVVLGGWTPRTAVLLTLGWCIRSWIGSSILGSAAVVAVHRARRPENHDADRSLPASTALAGGSRWSRLARRILGWIGRLRRSVERVIHRTPQPSAAPADA